MMKGGLGNARMKENLSEYIPRKIVQETIFNPRYRSIDKIGSGSFGEIHKVYDTIDKKLRAVKIEKKDKRGAQGMLLKEAYIMKQMRECPHFPRLIEEMSNDEMSFVIMSFLGPNLEQLKKKYEKLSNYTSLLIGSQMIEALQLLHSKGFLHRDIKPENFVIGTEANHHNIYIIDFGLSKKYIDINNKHIPQDANKGLVGTARYTSINSHKGIEQSRRDDLEALGYVLIYLAKGELPWQNLSPEKREEKFEQIKKLKMEISVQDLCQGLPESFQNFMTHVKSLEFDQEPKYNELKERFLKDAMQIQQEKKISIESSHCLDWCEESCSIRKQFAERLRQQKQMQLQKVSKEESRTKSGSGLHDAHSNDGQPKSNGKPNQSHENDEEEENKRDKETIRRETNFTETKNFYEDTVEKGHSDAMNAFEVPLFRTDQSLTLSRNSFNNIGQQTEDLNSGLNFLTVSKQINRRSQSDVNLLFNVQDSANQEHSRNSSQYNNLSSEYSPFQDEQVEVQRVILSSPMHFSLSESNHSKFGNENHIPAHLSSSPNIHKHHNNNNNSNNNSQQNK